MVVTEFSDLDITNKSDKEGLMWNLKPFVFLCHLDLFFKLSTLLSVLLRGKKTMSLWTLRGQFVLCCIKTPGISKTGHMAMSP
jgi:hypothetical protein